VNGTTTQQTAKSGPMRGALRAGLWVTLLLCLFAAPAHATQILQIRVGNHPTFTRLVFEMDGPAGYRIERRTAEDGSKQLLVTVDAASRMREIESKSVIIESVTVAQAAEASVAQIRLRKPDLLMKEMMLSNPPRIVLDFEFEPVAAAPSVAKQPSSAVVAQASPQPQVVEPEPVVTKPEPKVTKPEPISVKPEPKPEPEPVASELAKGKPATTVEVDAQATDDEKRRAALRALIPGVHKRDGLEGESAQKQSEALAAAPDTADDTTARVTTPTPEATAKPIQQATSQQATKPEATSDESVVNMAVVVAAVAGVLIVAFLAVRMLRKRSTPTGIDSAAFDDDAEFGAEPAAVEQDANERIPTEGFAMNEASATEVPPVVEENTAAYSLSEVATNATEPETGFFNEDSEGEKAMDLDATDLPASRDEFSAPPPMVAASGDTDVAELVQGLVSRIEGLETRLDESNEARERLERQVAAQSEELRVQRAAIARTQRALRSLSRSEEEQATEPALREPSNPATSSDA